MNYDHPEIQRTLKFLYNPGDIAELRVLHASGSGTVSGYFNDMEKLANAAIQWSGQAPGVYVTINPVSPDLLARSNNQTKPWVKQTTSDREVTKRGWFVLDFDPVRLSGISSTDFEHKQALLRATDCTKFLRERAFPEDSIIIADSGNGAHVLVRIDLPNDGETTHLIKRCIEAAAFLFGDDQVSVDLTVYNPARIWKLYGTMACKGDSTEDRPHRLAKLLLVPQQIIPAPIEILKKLAAMAPEQPKPDCNRANQHRSFDLARWLETNHVDVSGPYAWNNGRKWIFHTCPWNPDHTNRAAYIVEFPNGAIGAGCHHNGCVDKRWHDLRDVVEPGWRNSTANQDQDFTSDYTDGSSEVKWNREVNAGDLQRRAQQNPESTFQFLSVLGQAGYIVKQWTHMLASFPRVGKTDLLIKVIPEWLGEKVLYFSEESESTWAPRMRGLPHGYDHLTIVYSLGMSSPEIIQRIREGNETVVIIDTVRNLLGLKDESDNSQVAATLNPVISAARRSGKTLIMVHHCRKGGGDHAEGVSGGHAFLGAVDIALELAREGKEDTPRRIIRGWARVVQIQKLLYEKKVDGSMVALGSPSEVSFAAVKERAYELLTEDWQSTRKIKEEFPDPKPSIDQVVKALEQLAKEGLVERDPPIAQGKKQGKGYKWRRVENFTSDESSYRSEVKSQSQETPLH